MNINNGVKAVTARDSLVIDILCSEFGVGAVDQAMRHIDSYKIHRTEKSSIIQEHFNRLCYEWQIGNAKGYLESLATDLQHYIICHLMEDYINDKTRKEA
ncbi:hypothetical protein H6F42_15455 [Pseudanabaena sp. FACHB-1998]|uniref:hypothetical protein n=1 Tax=Pseudanabaena sp. FACHB-1998 TaxID=2692858 RepID=UPI001681A7F8|nr:hypothetical protein [Pseudanabaena sp. FACHB-1998]MBD2178314.1 hypothetical protein [Pseudanabaena sp. FACHB-1998]